MTIEEKKKKLNELCESHEPCCTDNGVCPLYKTNLPCDPDMEEEVNLVYKVAFGEPEVEQEVKPDMVNTPSHYTQGNIQCIDAMVSAFGKEAVATWCKINAFKYVWREEHKNGMEDIDKALWYLTKYKELKSSD